MSQRLDRVAEELRRELADIIRGEMKDPRVALATVSRVEPSRDFSHAVVWISVLGDDDEAREDAVAVLHRARGFVRSLLGQRIRLRVVPELDFRLDRGFEHSQRISDLLESLDDGTESS
jgi:ribosome-binding factor A